MARCMSSVSDPFSTQWADLLAAHKSKDAARSAYQEIGPQGPHATLPQKVSDPHPGWLAEWRKAREDFDTASALPGGAMGLPPQRKPHMGALTLWPSRLRKQKP